MEREKKVKKAVALRYDTGREDAPRVVASGKGYVAGKILEVAKAARVPIYEDAALAEHLSKLDLGSEIPFELYKMVAEILVFIYSIDRQQKSNSPGTYNS